MLHKNGYKKRVWAKRREKAEKIADCWQYKPVNRWLYFADIIFHVEYLKESAIPISALFARTVLLLLFLPAHTRYTNHYCFLAVPGSRRDCIHRAQFTLNVFDFISLHLECWLHDVFVFVSTEKVWSMHLLRCAVWMFRLGVHFTFVVSEVVGKILQFTWRKHGQRASISQKYRFHGIAFPNEYLYQILII